MNIFKPIAAQSGGKPSTGRRTGRRPTLRAPTIGNTLKTIRQICYKETDNSTHFSEISKAYTTNQEKNSVLFIYLDSFEKYGRGDNTNDTSGYSFREYRQDFRNNLGFRSLGIPVGFDDTSLKSENASNLLDIEGIINTIINGNNTTIENIATNTNNIDLTNIVDLFTFRNGLLILTPSCIVETFIFLRSNICCPFEKLDQIFSTTSSFICPK
jgi:hypothetical protein